MPNDPLDEGLLDRIMRSVRIEIERPMRLRVSKSVGGKVQDTHEFEVKIGTEVSVVQKDVIAVVRKWKGGFQVGMVYTVERVA